jgi:hypothetical protein
MKKNDRALYCQLLDKYIDTVMAYKEADEDSDTIRKNKAYKLICDIEYIAIYNFDRETCHQWKREAHAFSLPPSWWR